MSESYTYAEMLRTKCPVVEPVHRAALRALNLTPESHGLDAGSEIGLQA